MPNSYDIVDACALLAMTPPGTPDGELKAIMVSATDIPVDRIDACLAELKTSDMVNNLRGLAMLYRLSTGNEPTVEVLHGTFQGAVWNDDNEGHTTYKIKVVPADGEEGPTTEINVKTEYDL